MNNQTTVPKKREKLEVRPSHVLQSEGVGDRVLGSAASPAFQSREGRIKVGPGDSVEDVRKARKLMGIKGR